MPLRPDQAETVRALRRLAVGAAADFYADACALVERSDDLAAVTHLVGHCVREAESTLREALLPHVHGVVGDSTEAQDDADRRLREAGLEEGSAMWAFTMGLAEYRDRGTRMSHRESVDVVVDGLGGDDTLRATWHALRKRLHKWAHRRGVAGARPAEAAFWAMWEDAERLFVLVVSRVAPLVLDEVDRLIAVEAPTEADVERLREGVLRSDVAAARVFGRLQHPAWVSPLTQAGWFGDPPARERDEEAGSVGDPSWPASRFLARAAPDRSWPREPLVAAIEAVPVTDNQRVLGDLLKAASECPPASVAAWSERWVTAGVLDGIGETLVWGTFSHVSTLLRGLGEGGQAGAALRLARSLYRVLPPRVVDLGMLGVSRRPRTLADGSDFYYERGLAADVPVLASADPWGTLGVVGDLVDDFRGYAFADAPIEPVDGSERWIDDVAAGDPTDFSERELGGWLAQALYRAASGAVAVGCPALEVIAWLNGRGWHVYIRCALALLREHGTPEQVGEALADRHRVFDDALREEMLRLVEGRFADLSAVDRVRFLAVVEAGPDPEEDVRRAERHGWGPWSLDDARERAEAVRAHWVDRLRPTLPREWMAAHADLAPAQEEPPPPPPNPALETLDDLKTGLAEAPEETLARLARWEDLEAPPNVEAVAHYLEEAVKADRTRYARLAEALIGADATLVGALADGLRGGEGDVEDWGPALRLFHWAVREQREIPGRTWERWARERDGDPHWGWARKKIARLVDRAVWAGAIPWERFDAVWAVVRPLTDDPDPRPRDEGENEGRGAYNRAINTTRGDAFGALFALVVWAHRETGDALAAAPGVFEVLDAHLGDRDPVPAIQSVYGKHLPLLVEVAPRWVLDRLGALFAGEPTLRTGVWDGYGFARPRTAAAFALLRPVYLQQLEGLTSDALTEELYPEEPALRQSRVREEVGDRVDEVVQAYVDGWTGLKDGDVGAALFGHPVAAVRALAVERVGRFFRRAWDGHAPAPVVARAREAWDWLRARGDLSAAEGEAFALWPPAAEFDRAWVLRELNDALAASGGEAKQAFRVVEWLPGMADAEALAAMRVEARLLQGPEGLELAAVYADAVSAVLRAAANAEGEAATLATETVNRLIARGGPDLREQDAH